MAIAIRLQSSFARAAIAALESAAAVLNAWQERQKLREADRKAAAVLASLDPGTLEDIGIAVPGESGRAPTIFDAMGSIYCSATLLGIGRR